MYTIKHELPHGIMFHHFHDNKYYQKSPGSINSAKFKKLIKFIGRENILDADEFLLRLNSKKLKKNHMCLTFDDGIKSQIKVAFPILEELKIKAFFFIPSTVGSKYKFSSEIIRYFIYNHCGEMNNFFKYFKENCNLDINKYFKKNHKFIKEMSSKYKFYSISDIKYRLIRNILEVNEFNKIINKLYRIKKFDPKKILKFLYLTPPDIKKIKKAGHIIGLHSHTHPMNLQKLSFFEQNIEYKKNLSFLKKILKCNSKYINSISHPCGSYNRTTLKILKKLKIKIGFTNSIHKKKTNLEIPRQNHKYIIDEMEKI